ncbi:hypothetical protein GCM10022215_24200 [Nocardioides fonticola]|uniref:Head-to-tail adaptor n=1 Tax=Nocardioides fonticola TaxID=450363 RepID=A0ABP7XJT5_9ACTN
MDNPAQVSDLTARDLNGVVPRVGSAAAQTWLGVAWRALQRQRDIPDVVASLESGRLSRDDVIDVVCSATLRVLRNPEGLSETSNSTDDYSETAKRTDASIDVYFTAAELRRLTPTPVSPTGGISGSIRYT